MADFAIAFVFSLLATFLLVRFSHLHDHVSADHDLNGVQKFHAIPVPRIGGVGLVIGLMGVVWFDWFRTENSDNFTMLLMVVVAPAFCFGLTEDLTKKVGSRVRLLATAASAVLGGHLLGAWLSQLQTPGLDWLMASSPVVAILITCFAVAGVANSFNIIDGCNGLSSVVAAVILCGIAYVAFNLQDLQIMFAALAMIGALLGFILFNYPRGQIFLGDGGAYLIGSWVAELSVLLTARHAEVSKWLPRHRW